MDRKENESIRSKVLGICLILISLVIVFFVFRQLFDVDDTYVNIERSGKRIDNSVFYKYDGKIYALIPSGGYYIVEDADVDSFSVIKSEHTYHPSVVGRDKNHVYFGNVKIEDLNPKEITNVGNGYYTDGKSTYFCSPLSERNDEISYVSEIFGHLVHTFFKDKKPKSYIYPYHKLNTEKKISKINNLIYFVTDGDVLYYKGKPLENADINTIKQVSKHGEYFCDKNNVYYKNELLPIKNSGELEVVSVEQGDDLLYVEWKVNDLIFVPKHFFVPDIIEKRKPLSQSAKRAGWIGCNILVNKIPTQGKIFIISNGEICNKTDIVNHVNISNRLITKDINSRGWLMEILNCINLIPTVEFCLADMYNFEDYLHGKFLNNNNIRAKIRQQLQILRDRKVIEFLERGKYRKLF